MSKIEFGIGLILIIVGIYSILTRPSGEVDEAIIISENFFFTIGIILVLIPFFAYLLIKKDAKELLETIIYQKKQTKAGSQIFSKKTHPHYSEFKRILGRPVCFCSKCNPEFEEKDVFESYGEFINICAECFTVCVKNQEFCHSCGEKFLPFPESLEIITDPGNTKKKFVFKIEE